MKDKIYFFIVQIILAIEKKLYEICINECEKKNYCYEILENIRNFINFSFRDNINKNNIIITLNENKNDKIQIVKK